MPDPNADARSIYEHHAHICNLMADPKRLEIIDHLSRCEWGALPINHLAEAMEISKATVSQHLALLRDGQLVTSHKDGQHVYYRLAGPRVFEAWHVTHKLISHQLSTQDVRVVRERP